MRVWFLLIILSVFAGIRLPAQDQPATGQTTPPQTVPDPPVLSNTGKPMVLPFQCTHEDVGSAGFSCSEDAPCPVYLELGAAASAGNKFYVAGNIHSDAVTLYSVLLGSEDAGRSWREIHERIRSAGLDHLQFIDAETGWVGGQQLFPLPQDPFVLLTTDGGKSWRPSPVFGENSDYHFGSLQEMYFSSKTNGSLVVDRSSGGDPGPFALYESPDGGASWTVKEQSRKPLHVKGAPPPDADWRVRVDGVSKAFLMERRQGERWTVQASFAVNIGFCRLGAQ
jgi:photosystem II stability/assembly factor-like uncharacterized protein